MNDPKLHLLDMDELVKEAGRLASLLESEEPTMLNRAALHLIVTRVTKLAGLSLGQYLENTISLWSLAEEIERDKHINDNLN